MTFRILVPYWGNHGKYSSLVLDWLASYRALKLPHRVTFISDFDTKEIPGVHWLAFPVASKSQYMFDHKGAIVCAAIQAVHEPVLVLDADAYVQFDPEPLLRPFENVRFAMPADEGCLGLHIRNRHAQPIDVPKRCAGVLWFGGYNVDRSKLVADYKRGFAEIGSGKYYEERRLYEQHAWSFAAHWNNAPFLPRTLNWLDTNSRNGPNPEAAICHRIGQRKWNDPKYNACL